MQFYTVILPQMFLCEDVTVFLSLTLVSQQDWWSPLVFGFSPFFWLWYKYT